MVRCKIHIFYNFKDEPWGGGNQFLKALRDYFIRKNVYVNNPNEADIILFNSHHLIDSIFSIKKKFRNKIIIHRVDGPVFFVRGTDKQIDEIIFTFSNLFADGVVYQSKWSKEKCRQLGMPETHYERIIINAPDPNIFNRDGKKPLNSDKIKLIAVSWSPNPKKGFDIYRYLDKNLDFKRYEMTFVGNSPIKFKNIKLIRPLPSEELATLLKAHDIYITASKDDPCSNALIEALHCGLPAVARNSGGHPEIVGKAGELFSNEKDVIRAIERVSNNYYFYQSNINLPSIDDIGKMYYEFGYNIYNDTISNIYCPKQISFKKIFWFNYIKTRAFIWKIYNKFKKRFVSDLRMFR